MPQFVVIYTVCEMNIEGIHSGMFTKKQYTVLHDIG